MERPSFQENLRTSVARTNCRNIEGREAGGGIDGLVRERRQLDHDSKTNLTFLPCQSGSYPLSKAKRKRKLFYI
jgi:hypothetical protein